MRRDVMQIREVAELSASWQQEGLKKLPLLQRLRVRSIFTQKFLVTQGSENQSILVRENDWQFMLYGPTGNAQFRQVAAPELTVLGCLHFNAIEPVNFAMNDLGALMLPRSRSEEEQEREYRETIARIGKFNLERLLGKRKVSVFG